MNERRKQKQTSVNWYQKNDKGKDKKETKASEIGNTELKIGKYIYKETGIFRNTSFDQR